MLTTDDVRTYIGDRPELNRLLDREEFSQKQIDLAMKLAVAEFNEVPPLSQFEVEGFPYIHVLLVGTVYHLFFGGGILRSRNRLAYQTNGVNIDDEAHADIELQMANALKGEFHSMTNDIKIQLNVAQGWSNIPSEYMRPSYYRDIRMK